MTANNQEIEAKFYIQDIDGIKARLEQLEARITHERILETNIRFDLPSGLLLSEGRVLRLRRDDIARLTYKSPGANNQGVSSRTEIETTVGDFETAKHLLESLGYQPIFIYEKYRTTYSLQTSEVSALIMLDELPYGTFVEIEGDTVDSIITLSELLQLNKETAIETSYHALFERARLTQGWQFHNLTFENFRGLEITPAHLNIQAADSPRV